MHLPNPSFIGRIQHKVNFQAEVNWFEFRVYMYLPTPPPKQDVTQGQFLSRFY